MIFLKAVLPAAFLLGSIAACAQVGAVSGSAVSTPRGVVGQIGFSGQPMPVVSITGAPFSGVRESETTQTLADGTHISRKMPTQKIWRDADGRMRTERPMFMGPNVTEGLPPVIEIVDPVAGYRYALDTQGKIAHRTAISQHPPVPPAQNQPAAGETVRQGSLGGSIPPGAGTVTMSVSGSLPTARQRIESQRESLGTKTIDGVVVDGTKFTMTIPAGAQGNDRPMSTVRESWYSSELREMIESTSSDPRNGESIMRLTNIDRNNPDPSLFQVPADYEIVDEKGPFSINYHQ